MKNITIIERHIAKGNDVLTHLHPNTLKGQFVYGVFLIDNKKHDETLYVYEKDILSSKITCDYIKANTKRKV